MNTIDIVKSQMPTIIGGQWPFGGDFDVEKCIHHVFDLTSKPQYRLLHHDFGDVIALITTYKILVKDHKNFAHSHIQESLEVIRKNNPQSAAPAAFEAYLNSLPK